MNFLKRLIQNFLGFFNIRIIKLRKTNQKKNSIVKIFFPKLSSSTFFAEDQNSIGWVFATIHGFKLLANKIDKNFDWGNYDLFLDMGAHIGALSKTANLYGCKVIAIEPDINNFEILKKNLPNNDQVLLIHGQIVPKNYDSESYFYYGSSSSSGSTIRSEAFQQRTLTKKALVPSIKIDNLISKLNNQKILIKFNIEGSEWLIMDELKDLFKSKNIKGIFGQLHKIKIDQDYTNIIKFLENEKYKIHYEGNWEVSGQIDFYAYR